MLFSHLPTFRSIPDCMTHLFFFFFFFFFLIFFIFFFFFSFYLENISSYLIFVRDEIQHILGNKINKNK